MLNYNVFIIEIIKNKLLLLIEIKVIIIFLENIFLKISENKRKF